MSQAQHLEGRLLLRPVEAAELCGVSRTLMYELIARGEIQSIRVRSTADAATSRNRGDIRIPVEALRAWIQKQLAEDAATEAPAPAERSRRGSQVVGAR